MRQVFENQERAVDARLTGRARHLFVSGNGNLIYQSRRAPPFGGTALRWRRILAQLCVSLRYLAKTASKNAIGGFGTFSPASSRSACLVQYVNQSAL